MNTCLSYGLPGSLEIRENLELIVSKQGKLKESLNLKPDLLNKS